MNYEEYYRESRAYNYNDLAELRMAAHGLVAITPRCLSALSTSSLIAPHTMSGWRKSESFTSADFFNLYDGTKRRTLLQVVPAQ